MILRSESRGFPIFKTVGTAFAKSFMQAMAALKIQTTAAPVFCWSRKPKVHSPLRRKIEKLRR
jgi:hypothetical protein